MDLPDHTNPPQPPAPTSSVPAVASPATPKELALKHAQKALDLIAATMEDEDAPQSLRVKCAEQIMDRAWGKATQYIEQTQTVLTYQDLLTDIAVREQQYQNVITVHATPLPEPTSQAEAVAPLDWSKV